MSKKTAAPDAKIQRLTREESQKPLFMIREFFSFASLPQAKELYWELWKTTVTGSFNESLSLRERNNMVYFMEQLEKLIEAAYLITQQKKGHGK